MENPPIAKEISQYEENNGSPITVTTREVIYVSGENNADLGSGSYINMDEEVKVEEKYCGPITCILGTVLFFIFWPATAFMGCCLCDKRKVKKRRVD
tara:strand:+ start:584 stop:874 length:291 start_codon:yes stop_codon:yes gene_type:complete